MIQWPEHYRPERTSVHVRNELAMPAAPAVVWERLINAEQWPSWYSNSHNVVVEGGGLLRLGARFRWKTFGVNLISTVREFAPHERIAWDAHAPGIDAYHAWEITLRASGSYVVTEETQNGWLARLGHFVTPHRMQKYHELWLEGLREQTKQ